MNVTPNDITHTNPSPIRLLKTESDSNTINKRIRINTDEEGEGQAGRWAVGRADEERE